MLDRQTAQGIPAARARRQQAMFRGLIHAALRYCTGGIRLSTIDAANRPGSRKYGLRGTVPRVLQGESDAPNPVTWAPKS